MVLWKPCLREGKTEGWYHTHDWCGAEGGANSRALGEPTQQVTGDIRVCTPVGRTSGGVLGGSSPRGRSPVPPVSHHSSETFLGLSGPATKEQTPAPCNNHRTRTRSCSISSRGSGHRYTSHTLFLENKDQHTLRKEVAVIHNKNSPSTKNIKPM